KGLERLYDALLRLVSADIQLIAAHAETRIRDQLSKPGFQILRTAGVLIALFLNDAVAAWLR
ncbi:hypothetical protein ACC805_36690, partial [Rhizobium ruizarguesonis]